MDPLERWRRHLRRRCDAGAASIASYVVAAAVFIISSTVLLHFVVEPPGAMTNELEHLGLRTKAEETLALLVGAPGLPHAWDADFAAIESIQRLGLVERGTTARIDPDKFDALARGKLAIASAGNGGVDYAEAKAALGLSGYDFHLRAYPILKPGSDDPYGLSGFDAYRVAYVGHHANDGSITPEAQAEANALAGLNIDFNNGHRTLLAAGDVYKDTSGDLRDGLLPHIGALVEQTVISQGAGTKFDFHRVSAGAYSAFVPGSLTPPLTAALALSSDGATLGYAKNRELRAIVGKVDLTGVSANAGLTWREWVDTDRGNLSYDCDDYGFVEVSPNNGATWVRLTDTPAARSRDCADPLSGT
ncbi:MAG TPA: hypothetical protein VM582_00175, partial [Candidatus Thermoplasmatota archaeon]|nr:hypothetical protein [Candidatus Thermoplasmatota archaeon]